MRLIYAILAILVLALLPVGGCRRDGPGTAPQSDELQPDAREAIKAVNDLDRGTLIRLGEEAERNPAILSALRSIPWESVPPEPPTGNAQGARHADIVLYVSSRHAQFAKALFEDFDARSIDEGTLVDAILPLDAALAGVLRSHARLNQRSIETPDSILTYAALARAGISSYLHSRGLGRLAPLTTAQCDRLVEMSRSRDYSGIDELP